MNRSEGARRISIRRVAEAVGISPMAVSLALRELPGVSETTRQRVRAAAERLGYRPDPELVRFSALIREDRPRAYRAALAFLNVFPERDRASWEAYFGGLREGSRSRAESRGYRLEEFWTREPGMTPRRLNSILRARGIRGVLVPVLAEDAALPALDWSRLTGVALTDSPAVSGLARVAPDNALAMTLALDAVEQRGYRRPAALLPPDFDERTRRLHSAVMVRWLWARGLDLGLVCRADLAGARFAAWLAEIRPDVVLCSHADPYGRAWRELPVEDRPAFVSLAWSPRRAEFAGVDKRTERIGSHGVDQLIASLERGEYGLSPDSPTLHVPGVWRDGASCPPRS